MAETTYQRRTRDTVDDTQRIDDRLMALWTFAWTLKLVVDEDAGSILLWVA